MKIERITICNLTSIEGEQVIDFTEEPLRSAGLFAITGDMGAGKSTVLDAICLALYNRAPRFDHVERIPAEELRLADAKAQQLQAGNVAGILRRGERQGGAAVTFSTPSGERYEATWSVRLKRNGTHAAPERTLTRLEPAAERVEKGEIQTRIEQAVGLTYEQFTRTVILAQNSFANFLRAKAADKAALLEKLTGTEVYSAVSARIFRMAQEAEVHAATLESRREGLLHDRLDEPTLRELNERNSLLAAGRAAAAQAAEQAEREAEWTDRFALAAERLTQREAEAAAATKACMEARGDELRLMRYDDVQPMQPLYQEIKMRRADVEQTKADEAANNAALDTARRTMEHAAAQLDTARERTADAVKQAELRAPAISRGHALTGEMSVAAEQLRRLDEQLRQAGTTLTQRTETLAAKQEMLTRTADDIRRRQLHRQQLEVHRLMFEKFDLIKDKLSLLYAETHRNAESHKKQAELRRRIEELRAQSERAEAEQQKNQGHLNTLKSELLIHRQTNQGIDSAQLQRAAADNRNRLAALERAGKLWQHISEGYARIAERHAARRRDETELVRLRLDAEKAELAVGAADEAYGRVATAFTLSQSDNIVRLRKQLKEGRACPVCGATHHPYHTETERELGELLTNLEKEHARMQQQLEQARARRAELGELAAATAARMETDARALAELEERQQADVAEWAAFAHLDNSFADCSPTVNREARRMMLRLLTDNTLRAADQADRELEAYNFHQQQINRLNEEIAELDIRMADTHTALDRLHTEAHIAAAAADDLQRVIAVSDRACAEFYTDLDEMITLSGWFTEWKNNADGLRLRLTALHRDWQTTCTELDRAERAQALLREEIKGAETHVAEATRHLNQCRESRDATREQLEAKREELRRLFGQGSPAEEAEANRLATEQARAAETQARTACERAQAELSRLEGLREQLHKSRLDNERLRSRKQEELDLMILRFNGDHSPVQFAELDTIFTAATDWNALRRRLDTLRSRHALAERALAEARQALTALQAEAGRPALPEQQAAPAGENRDAAAAPAEHAAAYAALRPILLSRAAGERARMVRIDEETGQIAARLLSHQRAVERADRLTGELEAARADAREWARLNALFGSADGKKLRTVAQGCTFGYLVAHANHHLRRLSPRYELRTLPGTLTLEIVDREMFDEHRYVSSLSGGETFVVSLALALGLASLSSSGLAIGSLFIDEGFGHLDRASLDLVMLALSNLENAQGRKVGVISHTEQIRAQISPQIILRRRPGGGSVIDVR